MGWRLEHAPGSRELYSHGDGAVDASHGRPVRVRQQAHERARRPKLWLLCLHARPELDRCALCDHTWRTALLASQVSPL